MDTNSVAELFRTLIQNQQPANTGSYNLLLIIGALTPTTIAIVAWLKAKTALMESLGAKVQAEAKEEAARFAAEDAKKVAAETSVAVEQIHELVNSGKTAMQKRIDDLETEVKNTKDKLQIAAIQTAVAPGPAPIAVVPIAPPLAAITPDQLSQILQALQTRQIEKATQELTDHPT